MNQQQDHRRLQPPDQGHNLHQPPQAAPPPAEKCPRCGSENTKFCYYNNYSLSQPRYYCKNCRRYWTQGGTLRNVPVGGGCRRKPKRPKTSTTSSTSTENLTNQPITTPLHLSQSLTSMASVISGNSGLLPVNQNPASLPPAISPMVSFYTSGSFLSMQPGGQLGGGAGIGGGANMAQFQGLNLPSLETRSLQFRLENELLPPQRTLESWSQILVNNSGATSSASNPNFWSNNTTGGNGGGGSSINPNPWPDQ